MQRGHLNPDPISRFTQYTIGITFYVSRFIFTHYALRFTFHLLSFRCFIDYLNTDGGKTNGANHNTDYRGADGCQAG